MRTYTQLTQEQRYQIYSLMKAGQNRSEIAHLIKVHKSTINREVRRNRGMKGYRPKQAHQFSLNRRKKTKYRIEVSTWTLIETLLRKDWSPEQASGWLKENYGLQISHEWIYQHILMDKQAGGDLHRHLRCQKKRRKRYGSYDRRGRLKNRVSIDERPVIVDARQRLGDWEVDTIIGKGHRQAIVSLTERKARLALHLCIVQFHRNLKEFGRFRGLLRKPKTIHLLGSLEHLILRGPLPCHELQKSQHGHTMVAVGEGCMVITTRPVDIRRHAFQESLLLQGEC